MIFNPILAGGGGSNLKVIEGDYTPSKDTGSAYATISVPDFVYDEDTLFYAEVEHIGEYEEGTVNASIYSVAHHFLIGGITWTYQLYTASGAYLNARGTRTDSTYGNVYGGWGFKNGEIKLGSAGQSVQFKAGHTYHWKVITTA